MGKPIRRTGRGALTLYKKKSTAGMNPYMHTKVEGVKSRFAV